MREQEAGGGRRRDEPGPLCQADRGRDGGRPQRRPVHVVLLVVVEGGMLHAGADPTSQLTHALWKCRRRRERPLRIKLSKTARAWTLRMPAAANKFGASATGKHRSPNPKLSINCERFALDRRWAGRLHIRSWSRGLASIARAVGGGCAVAFRSTKHTQADWKQISEFPCGGPFMA